MIIIYLRRHIPGVPALADDSRVREGGGKDRRRYRGALRQQGYELDEVKDRQGHRDHPAGAMPFLASRRVVHRVPEAHDGRRSP